MYGIGFDCLLFHFAPSHLAKEGAPQTRVGRGPPNQSVPGAPNQSVMGGPQTRVCLGAPEGVNPPLRSIDPATFMPPLAKIPGSAPVLKNVCPGTTLYFQTDMLS